MKMFYKLSFLLCFSMLLWTCSKDPKVPIASMNLIEQEPAFSIVNEKVSAFFSGIVNYKGKIKGVTMKIWTGENQSDAELYTVSLVDGAFSISVPNLNPDAEYHYCYYINYGVSPDYVVEPKMITTPSLPEPAVTFPTVFTEDVTALGVRGNVTDDGGAPVIERGICYGPERYPYISGPHISAPIPEGVDGIGPFLVMPTLESGVYYVRAYAKNSVGLVGYGDPLILVTNFTSQQYTITVMANPANGGNVTGSGTYYEGEQCTVTATANTGYAFTEWCEIIGDSTGGIEVSVSSDADYTFTVNSDRTLVAKFIAQPQAPEGAINGLFTINDDGDQVFFSQGNLQYHTEEAIWRFAEHQYDHIASSSTNTWMDLFCWGTGDNPTLFSGNENDYTTFVDWGVNAISNGGNQAGMWHTLSAEEWSYIINERENAITKYGIGNVDSIGGLILLPDNWHCPIGLTFNPGFLDDFHYWYHNTYTVSEWQLMEDAGAVFLPAAGGKYVVLAPGSIHIIPFGYNERGIYWSFSAFNEDFRYLNFLSTNINPQETEGGPHFGYSVRLVCPAEN